MAQTDLIRTPDNRVRVFISSMQRELADERRAVRAAVTRLRLAPVMVELGAHPHSPEEVYRAYLAQSQIFVGIYWERYGEIPAGEEVSELENEYLLSAGLPRLIYVKAPAPERDPRLTQLLTQIRDEDGISYQGFGTAEELRGLVENDLAVLLSERFELAHSGGGGQQGAQAGTLPVPPTALVGRDREAGEVGEMLTEDGRLVVLTGPGGVGKSRLALEVAHRYGSAFGNGARYIDLSPVRSGSLVADAIAAGLGLRSSSSSLVSDLQSYLRGRRLLLVLDNFEQVADAAPVLAELLAAAPGVSALVTSRTVLRIRGEREYGVAGLPVPDPSSCRRTADLEQFASVALFVERARAVAPDFELTGQNARTVAAICRRLDGLPLAIELAAAKVRVMPPRGLLTRLDDRLKFLTGGARDLPERQRTLRSTMDWSFDLLTPGEQRLFAMLGVFPGTFDLSAAEDVGAPSAPAGADGRAAPGDAGSVTDMLSSLVDASLVRQLERHGEVRFTMLETLCEYALERLAGGDEWRLAHDRHAAHYLAFAQSAEPGLRGPSQPEWLDRAEAEHGNLTAATTWLLDQGEFVPAQQLGAATWRFWWFHGHSQELAHYGEVILDHRDELPDASIGLALSGIGFMSIAGGDDKRAQTIFREGLALFRNVGDKFGIAITAGAIGHLCALDGDFDDARKLLDESLALQQELGNEESVALVDNFLGQIPLAQGDPAAAAELFTEGLDVSRRVPDRFPLLVSLFDLALSDHVRGDLPVAHEHLREGIALAVEMRDLGTVGCYLKVLAAGAELEEDLDRAVRLWALSNALVQAAGSSWMDAYVPHGPSDHEVLTTLRAKIGDAAFDAGWAAGQSMTQEEALEYTLA